MLFKSIAFLLLSTLSALTRHDVPDPYRHLEDLGSEKTKAWVEDQNERTRQYFSSFAEKEALVRRVGRICRYEQCKYFYKHAGNYFLSLRSQEQNQPVLYLQSHLQGPQKAIFDPNLLSEDGTVSLADAVPSPDGKLLAYSVSYAGSDWKEIGVKDLGTGCDRVDRIRWVKFCTPAWSAAGDGFYYSRYEAPPEGKVREAVNEGQKVYFHLLGTSQEDDRLVYERPDKKGWRLEAFETDDGRYLVITVNADKALLYQDLLEQGPILQLTPACKASYRFAAYEKGRFYLWTDEEAPLGKLVFIEACAPRSCKTIIPQAEEVLLGIVRAKDRRIASYLEHGSSSIKLFHADGSFDKELSLPGKGFVEGFLGEQDGRETFYLFSGYTKPPSLYRYDFDADASFAIFEPELSFCPDDFETALVFYPGKDGTKIPMQISYKKGAFFNGSLPTLLYGYGGFGISVVPRFSPLYLAWMERGGVVAIANLRGGGEYGKEWHDAGRLLLKQNVFDDFIAAGEWLIRNQVTAPSKLAIAGASNGGLLVGACLTQRPDLFSAAIASAGVLDMLRFHLFTIGGAWISEYGSADDPEFFSCLYGYSPLHNIDSSLPYPPTLLMTGAHDDRVVPSHTYKFAAALQEAGHEALLRVEPSAGHGAGKPLSQTIEESADQLLFLTLHLGK